MQRAHTPSPTAFDAARVRGLVQDDRVHRDLYVDPVVFAWEQERLFRRAWLYLGHTSQVPNPGDYLAQDIAGQPLLMVRQPDESVRVLVNRCAHKGSKLLTDAHGHAGKLLRCPYHAWAYRLDGSLLNVPMAAGYEDTGMRDSPAGQGLAVLRHVAVHRGFVFVRLADEGLPFEVQGAAILPALDKLVERSPLGRLRIEGGCLRTVIHCNWKIYLENVNDTVHAVSTHESVGRAARAYQAEPSPQAAPSMAVEQLLPFASGYEFYGDMGARVLPYGHSVLGTRASIHAGYGRVPAYEAALRDAHGEQQAAAILAYAPQNVICYPSLAFKTSPQTLRVLRPLAVDRTLVEAWSLRLEGAPDLLFERTLSYNRLAFSPMSMVAHDDIHLFESTQQALHAQGNEWVSLHRGHRRSEHGQATAETDATNELLMRHQHRAWLALMTQGVHA